MNTPSPENVVDMTRRRPMSVRLAERIAALSPDEQQMLLDFSERIIGCFDPEIVRNFLALHDDPRLSSILQLAAALDDEGRDQLLFEAEAHYAEGR